MGEEYTQHLQSFNSWEGKIERCSQQKEVMQPGHYSPLNSGLLFKMEMNMKAGIT